MYDGHIYFGGWLIEGGTQVPVYWQDGTVVDVSIPSSASSQYTLTGQSVNQIEFPPYVPSQTVMVILQDSSYAPHGGYIVDGTYAAWPTGSATAGEAWWANTSPSGDVYATGVVGPDTTSFWSGTQAAYWKNGQLQTLSLPSGNAYGQAAGMFFSGNDVYINGNASTASGVPTPIYWVNGGQPQTLPTTGYTGGFQEAWGLVDF